MWQLRARLAPRSLGIAQGSSGDLSGISNSHQGGSSSSSVVTMVIAVMDSQWKLPVLFWRPLARRTVAGHALELAAGWRACRASSEWQACSARGCHVRREDGRQGGGR